MNTNIHSDPLTNQSAEEARDAYDTVQDAASDVIDATKATAGRASERAREAARRAGDKANEIYRSAAQKTGETLTTSKDYVRRNPVPAVLGAIAFGATIGCLLMLASRKPTFSERYAEEPLVTVRDAIFGALAPVAQRVHDGYDSACDGAGKAMDRVHGFTPGRNGNSWSHQIGRIGNTLKFW